MCKLAVKKRNNQTKMPPVVLRIISKAMKNSRDSYNKKRRTWLGKLRHRKS